MQIHNPGAITKQVSFCILACPNSWCKYKEKYSCCERCFWV